jgi:aminomethyltransferase
MSLRILFVAIDADETATHPALKHTPLHGLHLALGARMTPFAGYDMPVQYPTGVLREHLRTRAAAGLFDVSHMGQIIVRPQSGAVSDAARALERLVPVDLLGLAPGRQRYAFFTNQDGGILDDLMVCNLGDRLLLVVNAACKEADEEYLIQHLAPDCVVERQDRALIALQGPKAEAALARLARECMGMRFMDVRAAPIMGTPCIISRSGYTGEDGFEISTPADVAREIAEGLLESSDVAPVGLGARDSLRLEAGLCLYGSDIDETTSPVEAGLSWAIQNVRRRGGLRAGGFQGGDVILAQLEAGTVRRRVGLRADGRAPVRAASRLFSDAEGGLHVGSVTSGGFGPSIDAPVAMGYLPSRLAQPGTKIFAEVRGTRLPVRVATLPFIAPHHKRG